MNGAPGAWDLVLDGASAPALRWVGWLAGGLALVLAGLAAVRRARRGRVGLARSTTLAVVVGVWAVVAALHGLALRRDAVAPRAVLTAPAVEVRDGAGLHRAVLFVAQGGSGVRVTDERPGWRKVWLGQGFEGWAPEAAVALLPPPDPAAGD